MKIRACQLKVEPTQVEENLRKILRELDAAAKAGMDWVIFSELALSGYFVGDLWNRQEFLDRCEEAQKAIIERCDQLKISAIFGNVTTDTTRRGEDGRVRRYDSVIICDQGQLWTQPKTKYKFLPKTLLPNYGPFEDTRFFYDNRRLAVEMECKVSSLLFPVLLGKDFRAGVFVCEDIWDQNYAVKPIDLVNNEKLNFSLAISASPFDSQKERMRETVLQSAVKRLRTPFLYVNHVGCQNHGKTIYGFDGGSRLLTNKGEVVFQAPAYLEGHFDFKVNKSGVELIHSQFSGPNVPDEARVFESIRYATKEFLQQVGVNKIAIGVSGGIDSAVSAAILATLLPKENVFLINMPTRFNSSRTRDFAANLAKNLGLRFAEVSVQNSYEQTIKDVESIELKDASGNLPTQSVKLSPLNIENIQSRDRGSRLLAALASGLGAAFVCNVNKSELVSGWGTFYGDLTGVMAPLGDLWKWQVYDFGRYLNATYFQPGKGIPESIFDVIPSAELSADHDIEKGLGDPFVYPYHDKLFQAFQEWDNPAGVEQLQQWYDDGTLATRLGSPELGQVFSSREEFLKDLHRWWKSFHNLAVAKRIQAPPIVAASPRPFGFDYHEPQGVKV
jgi:NAD+ synthase (glutamine-hydrolysing)